MKTIKDKLQLALEALITINNAIYVNSQQEAAAVYKANDAITALKEALTSVPDGASEAIEQPAPVAKPHEQEPVAIDRSDAVNLARNMLEVRNCKGITSYGVHVLCEAVMKMDTALRYPPPCQPEPLTDEEIKAIIPCEFAWIYEVGVSDATAFARAIEAAHGIKEKNSD